MQITNESLLRVVHFSYATGALLMAACTCLGVIVGSSDLNGRSSTSLLGAFLLTFFGGILVITLGALLNSGRIWALYGICILAALLGSMAGLLVMFSGKIRAGILLLPVFALGATCLSAWPEARWLRRKRRAPQVATTPTGALTIAPPPPAGGRSRRG